MTYSGQDFDNVMKEESIYKKHLKEGVVYTLKKVTPYEEYAIVELAEFPGINFQASAFFYLEKRDKSEEELLEEYGSALQVDLRRMDEIKEEIDGQPKPTALEELQQYYEDVKGRDNCDALDDMIEFLTPEECQSQFNVGDNFYDEGRNITVLYVSDKSDRLEQPVYFCKIREDHKGLTWYFKFDQRDMEIIKITDKKFDENSPSEKQKLIRKIMLETGGILWTNALLASEVQLSPETARAHKYNVGDTIKSENGILEIVYVSPEIDCDNDWVYLCRENYLGTDGKQRFGYSIMRESVE